MTSDRNPMEALNQALREQRMDGAEKSALEVISRALGVPLEIVHRVIFAYEKLSDVYRGEVLSPNATWNEIITSEDVRRAIDKHMEVGARRYAVRRAIEANEEIEVATSALISEPGKICNGCPQQIECIAESLYTPEQCYHGRLLSVSVVPLRMHKGTVEVDAKQPLGRFTIPVTAVRTKRY